MVDFVLVSYKANLTAQNNTAYLEIDNWDDFSFKTSFALIVFDGDGLKHEIGAVKIGYKGQTEKSSTREKLEARFSSLPAAFFSLGQGEDFYKKIHTLQSPLREEILAGLNDIVFAQEKIDEIRDEQVFGTSLLRDISLSIVKGQYKRLLDGQPALTDFDFFFHRPKQENMSEISLGFTVKESSTPSTNIHAVIGRNGVGKTTLLNDMIVAITNKENTPSSFYEVNSHPWGEVAQKKINADYFSRLVSISFSAFDPFEPPREQANPAKGTCYFYVGLKSQENPSEHYSIDDLRVNCAQSMIECFTDLGKATRWKRAIEKLGSDENFARMDLAQWLGKYQGLQSKSSAQGQKKVVEYLEELQSFIKRMSSGHAIVLLSITRLVATVEEKTLVLLDEPESHLHPPLLSAFIRALSDLLYDRNGVAIIATHSPVVLQEIPKSCVWKINRIGLEITCKRPEAETFGENVGVLTGEVFGLEVIKSGFYDLIVKSVEKGSSYDEILQEYGNQLGMEGRALLKVLIVNRDKPSVGA